MKLTLYSMNGCVQCNQATQFLKVKGVEFDVVKIDEDFEAWEFLKGQGHKSMPQIYLDGKLFVEGGFSGLKKLADEDFEDLKK